MAWQLSQFIIIASSTTCSLLHGRDSQAGQALAVLQGDAFCSITLGSQSSGCNIGASSWTWPRGSQLRYPHRGCTTDIAVTLTLWRVGVFGSKELCSIKTLPCEALRLAISYGLIAGVPSLAVWSAVADAYGHTRRKPCCPAVKTA